MKIHIMIMPSRLIFITVIIVAIIILLKRNLGNSEATTERALTDFGIPASSTY
jgi:hypothetical protein